jgi:hypothetical protein
MTRRSKPFVVATGLFLVVGAVTLGTLMGAQAEARSGDSPAAPPTCSNRTLRGSYGFSIEGTILAGTPNAFAVRGVAMTQYDGEGNLTQVDFTTRNGVPFNSDWRPGSGTYEINADCTGSAHIIQSDGTPSVSLKLVVVDRGREVRATVVGNSTSSVGIRVE